MAVHPGVASSLAIGDATSSMNLIDFENESLSATIRRLDANGIKGTRDRNIARVRPGPIEVGGGFNWNPPTSQLAYILPKAHGAAASGTSYPLGETISSFMAMKQMAASNVWTFPVLFIDSYTLSSQPGGMVDFAVNCLGTTSPTFGTSFPSLTLDTTHVEFTHAEATLSIGGTEYECLGFSLTLSNAIQLRQANSRVATAAFATDRVISVQVTIPAGDANISSVADTPLAVVMTYSALNQSLALSMIAVSFENVITTINPRGENVHVLDGLAYRSSDTPSLVTTLDSTP